ncbi:hypothetical protein X737_27555 [Mesorhizobium sp. L48C026A00]|nr:hypothetical protein X737_27555 [Mesorhizobium sp. L48C026A00]
MRFVDVERRFNSYAARKAAVISAAESKDQWPTRNRARQAHCHQIGLGAGIAEADTLD